MQSLMYANVVCSAEIVIVISFLAPILRVESYLRDTIAFDESIEYGDQICYPCYKFFNQMLKSDVWMLSSGDVVLELEAKKETLERIVHGFSLKQHLNLGIL